MRIRIWLILTLITTVGVKKYQWVALPMAMHGVIVKKDGTVVNVTVGEDEDDPVLTSQTFNPSCRTADGEEGFRGC